MASTFEDLFKLNSASFTDNKKPKAGKKYRVTATGGEIHTPTYLCKVYLDKVSGDYIIQGKAVDPEKVEGLCSELNKNERLIMVPECLLK